jgi:hypothetical protein
VTWEDCDDEVGREGGTKAEAGWALDVGGKMGRLGWRTQA